MNSIAQESDAISIKSLSFSYNELIVDVGATIITQKIPASISELGLVGCAI
mgnify:FL=1